LDVSLWDKVFGTGAKGPHSYWYDLENTAWPNEKWEDSGQDGNPNEVTAVYYLPNFQVRAGQKGELASEYGTTIKNPDGAILMWQR
jgi:hypothetical protein